MQTLNATARTGAHCQPVSISICLATNMDPAKSISRTIPAIEERESSSLEALKQEYLACVATAHSTPVETVRGVVMRLAGRGVGRKQLVQWAVDAGNCAGYVRSLLSGLFCGNGQRIRKPGAGRETPQAALAILAYATSQHGERAEKLLYAAAYAARKKRLEANWSQPVPQVV
jgi:hypothetical protein